MPHRHWEINLSQRWSLIGATGAGKTTFARKLIARYMWFYQLQLPIYIIDPKNVGDFDGFLPYTGQITEEADHIPGLGVRQKGKPVTIWHPDFDDLNAYDTFFDLVLYGARKHGMPGLVVVDEMGSITNKSGQATQGFEKLERQGRGLKVPIIGLTQSSAQIPFSMLRQASYIVLFTIDDEYDRRKLVSYFGNVAKTPPPDAHGFYVRNKLIPLAREPVHYYRNAQEFFQY